MDDEKPTDSDIEQYMQRMGFCKTNHTQGPIGPRPVHLGDVYPVYQEAQRKKFAELQAAHRANPRTKSHYKILGKSPEPTEGIPPANELEIVKARVVGLESKMIELQLRFDKLETFIAMEIGSKDSDNL